MKNDADGQKENKLKQCSDDLKIIHCFKLEFRNLLDHCVTKIRHFTVGLQIFCSYLQIYKNEFQLTNCINSNLLNARVV